MIKDFLKKYKYIIIIFLLTTIFFLWQYFLSLSWDFIAYVLNAKNIFNSGLYYETFRPPLTSIIIGVIAQITGYFLAEIIYIILVNLLFCISIVLISRLLKMNTELLYLSIITPFFLTFALINGTELLFLTFLLIGIYFILKDNYISGLFMALSALSRYAGIVFGAFLLFHKGIKNKIKSITLFCLTFVPWFIYNKIKYNNYFTSIADQFHQNIISRLDIAQAPKIMHFVNIQSIFFIFTFIGLIFSGIYIFKNIKKHKTNNKSIKKNITFMIIIFILLFYTIYSYLTTPFKDIRYLFALVLPIGYFTYLGFNSLLKNKKQIKIAICMLFLVILITGFAILKTTKRDYYFYKQEYLDEIKIIKDSNLQECVMYSEIWIFYNYLDENIIALPIEIYENTVLNHNDKVLLLYKNNHSQEVNKKLQKYNVINETDKFIISGDLKNCKTKKEYNNIFYTYNSLYTNPCNILFNKIKIAEKICYAVNFEKKNN